jgi:amidohydrolase
MSKLAIVTALTVIALVVMPSAQTPSAISPALRTRIDALAAELLPWVTGVRRDLHQYPELGFRETRTAGFVADRLRAMKFDDVRTGIGGTGVVGILAGGRPGPVVAVRADMDALPLPELNDVPYKSTVPNVMHACGHDGHTAIALGVAEIFSRLRADVAGTIVMLFQPAEEGDPDGGKTGALRVLDDWPFTNPAPAAIFGLHLVPMMRVGLVGVNSGAAMASSDRFNITIQGKSTHGAMPHTGLDPIPVAAQVVLALQTIPSRQMSAQEPTVVSVGTIAGGARYNIIADSVKMEGTVRSLSPDGPATVKKKMEAILKGVTSSYDATYTLNYAEGAPVTVNEPALAAASSAALVTQLGRDKVTSPAPQMVAEDFAYYQKKIPGFYFFVGVANPDKGITAMWHTEYYDMDEDALGVGMRAMSAVVFGYLNTRR